MACAPVAQAVAVAVLAPLRLCRIETFPAQALTISFGTVKGLIFIGASLEEFSVSDFDCDDATDARTNRHSPAIWITGLKIDAAVECGFLCSNHAEQADSVHSFCFAKIDDVREVEIMNFATKARGPILILIK